MRRKMKKMCLLVIGALLLVLTGSAIQSEAGVNVRVYPPDIRFPAPPSVVVIPGTNVYMIPDVDVDVMFYQGYWWRPYEGRWYRSRDYKRGWRQVGPRSIPRGLSTLPQDYRQRISPGHERIPHRDVKRNWRKWEKEKHWDRRDDQDRRGHGDQDNRNQGDQDRGRRDEQKGRN